MTSSAAEPARTSLEDGDLALVSTSGAAISDGLIGFAIELSGQPVGTVVFQRLGDSHASVRWDVSDGARSDGVPMRSLKLAVDHVIDTVGLRRVEALIDRDDTVELRAASIAGLRREGIVRGDGDHPDQVMVARLAQDPDPFTRDGFIAILNAGLPTKRVISQGVLRDEHGRVLLCELTYKNEWDLPGGVVEVGESPALGLVRELQEELGITVEILGLHTVNWLPAWRGWDDACVFVFDLGVVDSSITDGMSLQPTEIRDVHWCDEPLVTERATAAAQELLGTLAGGNVPPYREAPKAD